MRIHKLSVKILTTLFLVSLSSNAETKDKTHYQDLNAQKKVSEFKAYPHKLYNPQEIAIDKERGSLNKVGASAFQYDDDTSTGSAAPKKSISRNWEPQRIRKLKNMHL